ncbi:c-type cytochrome [Emticicia fontis]
MDVQKTIVKVLELFKTLVILYGLSWVIFAATAFYYIDNQSPEPPPAAFCGVVTEINLSELGTKGETLFKDNCSQCHAVTNEAVVGPGLQGIEQRKKVDWIRKWVRNPKKVLDSGDKYANELYVKFNKTQMTAFPDFKDEDIDAILKYIAEVNK